MKATTKDYDIKFTSLPSTDQVVSGMSDQGRSHQQIERLAETYRNAMFRIQEAQKLAAVIAVQALRPGDWNEINQTRKAMIREANEQARKRALEVFSDYCTRGL
jgi:hypothetical protein